MSHPSSPQYSLPSCHSFNCEHVPELHPGTFQGLGQMVIQPIWALQWLEFCNSCSSLFQCQTIWPGESSSLCRAQICLLQLVSVHPSSILQLQRLSQRLCHGTACKHLKIIQFSSVAQSCPTLCDPMNRSTPGLPVHHQLPEFTQTHIHRVSDAIQPSHPLSSPSPPAPNPSQNQSLFQWVNSLHEVAKVLEFQL